jgi:hypothetical protein
MNEARMLFVTYLWTSTDYQGKSGLGLEARRLVNRCRKRPPQHRALKNQEASDAPQSDPAREWWNCLTDLKRDNWATAPAGHSRPEGVKSPGTSAIWREPHMIFSPQTPPWSPSKLRKIPETPDTVHLERDQTP